MWREVAFVAEDKEGEWTLYDDRGCELDHTMVRFNRETGHYEAEPLPKNLADEDSGISITTADDGLGISVTAPWPHESSSN